MIFWRGRSVYNKTGRRFVATLFMEGTLSGPMLPGVTILSRSLCSDSVGFEMG
jgi:hypothetical protein